MKHAILMLIHENIELVNKLLLLYPKEVDIFIHIDNSSNIDVSDINLLSNIKQVIKKVKCEWGKMSLVDATLELIKTAGNNYMYYHLVSGSCLPLCNILDLNKLIYPKCYITAERLFTAMYCEVYLGSLWWSLPNIVIQYILNNESEIIAIKNSIPINFIPDELIFSTLVYNHFSDLIVNNNKRFIKMCGMHPRYITKKDDLKDYLFARKVNLDYFKNN